jgi:hypothetical protein
MTGSIARVGALLLLVTSLAACGRDKEIAEKDVKAAEQALAGVQDDGAKLMPDRMKAVNRVIENAKDQLIAGDYRAAMKAAQDAMLEAQALPAAIASRKQEMTTQFKAASDSVPRMLATVKARLDSILASKKLPPGVDAGKVAVLKAELPGWEEEWRTATASFERGDVVAALRKAIELKARAQDAMATLGLH